MLASVWVLPLLLQGTHIQLLMPTLCCLQAMKSPELKDQLEESEKLIQEMTVTWEEKLRKTEEIAQVGVVPRGMDGWTRHVDTLLLCCPVDL